MAISDKNPHCVEDLYAKYLQFTNIMLEEYDSMEAAAIMATLSLSLYKTCMSEEDYQRMTKSIYDNRNNVKTF